MNTNHTNQLSRSRPDAEENAAAEAGGRQSNTEPARDSRIAPPVRALIAALDAIDGPAELTDQDSPATSWGTSGLGAEHVTEADIEALARQHHRLMAQIGRLIRGPVVTGDNNNPPNAGSLIQPDPSSPPDQERSSKNQPHPDAGPAGDADGDRAAIPFGAQTTLVRRGWRPAQARTIIVVSRFAAKYPEFDQMWRAGDISTDAIFALRQTCRKLSADEEASFMQIMLDHIPYLTYPEVRRLTCRVLDLIRPSSVDDDEEDAHRRRSLTFSTLGGTVLFQGQLPKLEGLAFQDTITAIAEQQRAEGDLITPGQRNADALTQLIVSSALAGDTPTLGGLPVAVTLTMSVEQAAAMTSSNAPAASGSQVNGTDRLRGPAARATYPNGDLAATNTARFALCCSDVTPITCTEPVNAASQTSQPAAFNTRPDDTWQPDPASLLGKLTTYPPLPVAVGRSQRLATSAQRKALAVRDGGCVITGCEVPPNRTQPHHVTDYSLGGATDLDNLASVCWVHHRQVDHEHWRLTRNSATGSQPYWKAELILPYQR